MSYADLKAKFKASVIAKITGELEQAYMRGDIGYEFRSSNLRAYAVFQELKPVLVGKGYTVKDNTVFF